VAAGTDDLTPRERRDWLQLTRELQAPCSDPSTSVDQCVREKLPCPACKPASDFVLKAIRDGRARDQIEEAFRLRFSPDRIKPIDLSDAPSFGPASAEVTVVEFADFQCPACARTVQLLDQLVSDFSPHVRIVFKHYPLPSHPQAESAARAAVAAQLQGKFWEMHHKLFAGQKLLSPESIEEYARDAGLDVARLKADAASPDSLARVRKQLAEGNRIGVASTPSLFINGRSFDLKHFELSSDLSDWVAAEIEIVTGKDAPRPSPRPANSSSADRNR